MKDKIHPSYQATTITCTCGNTINTRSTKKNIKVEICANCHPFYTGQQKFVDIAGRVDRFKKKFKTAGSAKPVKKSPAAKKEKK